MKKNYEKRGFELNDFIREQMKVYRETIVKKSLRDVVDGLNMSHMTWSRLERGIDTSASWDSWNEIYRVLSQANLIDKNDIELMSPDRMREILMTMKKDNPSIFSIGNNNDIKQAAIGTGATVQTGGSFDDVIDAIMSSDMCDGCKVKAFNIIKSCK